MAPPPGRQRSHAPLHLPSHLHSTSRTWPTLGSVDCRSRKTSRRPSRHLELLPLLYTSATHLQLIKMPHNYSKSKTYPNTSFLAPSAIPPVLPPSVEEAYRRKCIQLRSRTQTVSDANDAARIRLLRMRRGIEKMRLERAFLLEQVARRVKPNDDSSDGSPSPPPTVGNCPNLLYTSHLSTGLPTSSSTRETQRT